MVYLLLLTLFLPSDFVQSQHLFAWEIWGFTGVKLKFPLYGKDTNGLTPHRNTIIMCPRKVSWLRQVFSQEEQILE